MQSIELSFWVSRKDIAFFTKNFAVMLKAGLTVVEALSVSEEQTHGKLQRVVKKVRAFVEQGNTLAAGLARHRQFSPIYVDVIRTGELSGTLARNVEQMANRLSDDLELRRKVRGAMIYPFVIFAGIIALGTVLSVFVMPRFIRLFSSLDVPLPYLTQVTLVVAAWLQQYWWWFLFGLVVFAIAMKVLLRIAAFERVWHACTVRLPVIGPMIRAINLARFTGTLGSLLNSGVPISEALHSVIHSCTNLSYQYSLRRTLQAVEHGESLSSRLAKQPALFPPLVVRMIAVGERTGQLSELLQYLGHYYEGQVDTTTKQLGILIGPLLLIVIGVVVIIIGLAVITPIYQFTASVGAL
jgi:type IV pilus assembly protein PilC